MVYEFCKTGSVIFLLTKHLLEKFFVSNSVPKPLILLDRLTCLLRWILTWTTIKPVKKPFAWTLCTYSPSFPFFSFSPSSSTRYFFSSSYFMSSKLHLCIFCLSGSWCPFLFVLSWTFWNVFIKYYFISAKVCFVITCPTPYTTIKTKKKSYQPRVIISTTLHVIIHLL